MVAWKFGFSRFEDTTELVASWIKALSSAVVGITCHFVRIHIFIWKVISSTQVYLKVFLPFEGVRRPDSQNQICSNDNAKANAKTIMYLTD